jgi:hypothetical protein
MLACNQHHQTSNDAMHTCLSFFIFYKIVKHENKFHFGFESCDYKKMIQESRKMKLGASKIQKGNSKFRKSKDTSIKQYSNDIYLSRF